MNINWYYVAGGIGVLGVGYYLTRNNESGIDASPNSYIPASYGGTYGGSGGFDYSNNNSQKPNPNPNPTVQPLDLSPLLKAILDSTKNTTKGGNDATDKMTILYLQNQKEIATKQLDVDADANLIRGYTDIAKNLNNHLFPTGIGVGKEVNIEYDEFGRLVSVKKSLDYNDPLNAAKGLIKTERAQTIESRQNLKQAKVDRKTAIYESGKTPQQVKKEEHKAKIQARQEQKQQARQEHKEKVQQKKEMQQEKRQERRAKR